VLIWFFEDRIFDIEQKEDSKIF